MTKDIVEIILRPHFDVSNYMTLYSNVFHGDSYNIFVYYFPSEHQEYASDADQSSRIVSSVVPSFAMSNYGGALSSS